MSLKFITLLIVSFLMAIENDVFSQLVNVESQRIQADNLRSADNANLNFSYEKNNNKPLIIKSNRALCINGKQNL